MDLSGLNPDQMRAVCHEHQTGGPLLILAAAGSGKTAVLIKRIQWLLSKEGVDPRTILGLTFTAKAAREMLERIGNAPVRLCTFHSLALSFCREFSTELGFQKPPVPTDQPDREFLENLFQDHLSPSELQSAEPLRKACKLTGKVVFEDLIWLAIQLLEQDETLRHKVQARYSHILVDEYQDINPSQYRLVRLLRGNSPALFVVGDDDQAIYGFRGADIGNILRFQKDYPEASMIKLEWNYRSTHAILEVANQIFTSKPLHLQKRLRAGSARRDPLFQKNFSVDSRAFQNPIQEVDFILGTMESMRTEFGLPWNAFAILVRYNRQKEWYSVALEERGIPIEAEGVQLETLHGSKGLQYPVVFYCGLAKNLSPAEPRGNRRQRKAQSEEEKRLFYVGVTRAESRLLLLFCRKRHWHGELQDFKESPYLQYVRRVQAPPHSWSFPMKIVFRLTMALKIVLYMGWSLLEFFPIRLFQKQNITTWVSRKLYAWAKFCLATLRMRLDVQGRSHLAGIDWNRPVFIVSNHQSYSDIPTILVAVERVVGFVAKRELALIPFMGYWMNQIGCLLIDRKKSGVGQEVNEAIRRMPHAPNLVIFPEGTRSKNKQLQTFKSGAFRMAIDNKGILLPVVLHGSREGWETRADFSKLHDFKCEILAPIDCRQQIEANPSFNHKDLMVLAKSQIQERLTQEG